MNPKGNATLHRKGGAALIDRWIASGTMTEMVRRFMQAAPNDRRELIIMHEAMEYQPAEIQNLGGQYLFSEGYVSERKNDALSQVRNSRAKRATYPQG